MRTPGFTFKMVVPAVLILLLATACTKSAVPSGNDPKTEQGASSSNQPQPLKELVLVEGADATSLDPTFATDRPSETAMTHIYNGLVRFKNPSLKEIVPDLAESWTVSQDGLTWTFKLKTGITFSDGSPFNSEAVGFTFRRYLDPKLNSAAKILFEPIQKIETPDSNTVVFKTVKPFAALLENLATINGSILSPIAVQQHADPKLYGRKPVGTGPYVLKDWIPGQQIVLERNPKYFGTVPKVERILYKPVPDSSSRVTMLESGQADIVMRIPPEAVENLKAKGNTEVLVEPSTFQVSFEFNHRLKPFDDVRVRQAVINAVDRQAIVKTLLRGMAGVSESPFTEGTQAHVKLPAYDYNPEKAKTLLREAGLEKGFKTEIWTSVGRYQKDKEIAEAIQSYLASVGIEAEIKTFEWATYLKEISKKDKTAGMYILGVSIPTADYRLNRNFRSTSGSNRSGYANARLDKLLDEARATFNEGERNLLYQKAQEIIWKDAVYLFAYDQAQIIGVKKGLKRFEVFGYEVLKLGETVRE